MNKPNDRQSALESLLALDRPIEELQNELASFAWDAAPDLVTLTRRHIRTILERFMDGALSAEMVELWADAIELRDDIDFAEDERIIEAVFTLANPDINGRLDHQLAEQVLSSISD